MTQEAMRSMTSAIVEQLIEVELQKFCGYQVENDACPTDCTSCQLARFFDELRKNV